MYETPSTLDSYAGGPILGTPFSPFVKINPKVIYINTDKSIELSEGVIAMSDMNLREMAERIRKSKDLELDMGHRLEYDINFEEFQVWNDERKIVFNFSIEEAKNIQMFLEAWLSES